MRSVSWLCILAGCGRIHFGPADDLRAADGGVGVPMLVAELSSPGADDDPTLTADLLEIYFASDRAGGAGGDDIWRSVRESVHDPWQPPEPVAELNSAQQDEAPGITADGLEIYLSSSRGGGNDIWRSTRASREDPWLPPTLVTELSSGSGDFQAQPSPSKLRLVMYRSSGDRDIYESTRAAVDQPWTSPVPLSTLSSPDGDRSPCLYGNELEIVFSSDRDSGMFDVQDLFRASRPALGDQFGPAVPLTTVNSPADDDDPWISPDGRVMYFSSDRSGDLEIYEVRF